MPHHVPALGQGEAEAVTRDAMVSAVLPDARDDREHVIQLGLPLQPRLTNRDLLPLPPERRRFDAELFHETAPGLRRGGGVGGHVGGRLALELGEHEPDARVEGGSQSEQGQPEERRPTHDGVLPSTP
jgi:hypothetical protein